METYEEVATNLCNKHKYCKYYYTEARDKRQLKYILL